MGQNCNEKTRTNQKSSTRVQPEATANYKCLFFSDGGQMPAAIQDQHSVPHGKLVAYKSYIEVIKIFKLDG